MTYVLVLIACLDGNCKQEVLARDLSVSSCFASSQIEAARWAGDHPGWKIQKINCEMGEPS
jgi:hypothetical protein